jgi:hypothetical protein
MGTTRERGFPVKRAIYLSRRGYTENSGTHAVPGTQRLLESSKAFVMRYPTMVKAYESLVRRTHPLPQTSFKQEKRSGTAATNRVAVGRMGMGVYEPNGRMHTIECRVLRSDAG